MFFLLAIVTAHGQCTGPTSVQLVQLADWHDEQPGESHKALDGKKEKRRWLQRQTQGNEFECKR